jgi:hypothetical protein
MRDRRTGDDRRKEVRGVAERIDKAEQERHIHALLDEDVVDVRVEPGRIVDGLLRSAAGLLLNVQGNSVDTWVSDALPLAEAMLRNISTYIAYEGFTPTLWQLDSYETLRQYLDTLKEYHGNVEKVQRYLESRDKM